jgi:hypothetical protein
MMIEHVTDVQVLRPARAMLLTVREGQVWLTRAGDAEDHVLAAGERLAVAAGEPLYVEPWRRGEAVRLSWQALPAATPVALPVLRTAMAQGLRRVADGLRDAARRVDVPPPACPAA